MPRFSVEHIPDNDTLFRRLPKVHFDEDGCIAPIEFRDYALSVKWKKYSSIEETRSSAGYNPPENYKVGAFIAGEVRMIPQLKVKHTPRASQAHSEIFGEKDVAVRLKLRNICEIVG